MIPTIYYHPEAYSISGKQLMGRNAAGESFLRGYLKHSQSKEFWAQVEDPKHAVEFSKQVVRAGREEQVRSLDKSNLRALSQAKLLYFPGPDIGKQAFHRSAHGSSAWSLCGITHTTSSARAMDSIVELLTCPVQPWDALICTSTTVKNNVEKVLQAEIDYLKDRLGITKFVLPELPIIPLGVHTDDFHFSKNQKNKSRKDLNISDETIVVLYMGRLSFHAKAHPLAMYQAIEKAAQKTKKDILLIECGWHANDGIKKAYEEAASIACPSIKVITLDGRQADQKMKAWASADIFCSLSDNIQETFGIVPIEAMAASLPVVVSDWDGYKDTIRHGIDGFRIETIMPQNGLGRDLAYRHAMEIDNYDIYCGLSCALISVNIEAAAIAFEKLILSSELRSKMGIEGYKRVKKTYDWKIIINQYENLWDNLNNIRQSHPASQSKELNHRWPARMDPFFSFGAYPSDTIYGDTILELVEKNLNQATDKAMTYSELSMVKYARLVMPTKEEIKKVLQKASSPSKAIELVENIDDSRKSIVFRSLTWFMKLGILKKHSEDF